MEIPELPELSFEVTYNPETENTAIITELLSRARTQHFRYRPNGDKWFLADLEFKGWVNETKDGTDEDGNILVDVGFELLPGSFVDRTDQRLYARILRYLYRFRRLQGAIDKVAELYRPKVKT